MSEWLLWDRLRRDRNHVKSRKESKIEIILTTRVRLRRQGQQGLSGDSPWHNLGLKLVILGINLRREAREL